MNDLDISLISEIGARCHYSDFINLLSTCKIFYNDNYIRGMRSQIKISLCTDLDQLLLTNILIDNVETVKLIINKIQVQNVDYDKLFEYSIRNNSYNVVKLLLPFVNFKFGFGENYSKALEIACSHGYTMIAKLLIDDLRVTTQIKDHWIFYPWCKHYCYDEIVELILNKNIISKDYISDQILNNRKNHFKVLNPSQSKILQLLLDYVSMDYADDYDDNEDYSFINYVVICGNTKQFEYLLNNDLVDKDTLLYHVSSYLSCEKIYRRKNIECMANLLLDIPEDFSVKYYNSLLLTSLRMKLHNLIERIMKDSRTDITTFDGHLVMELLKYNETNISLFLENNISFDNLISYSVKNGDSQLLNIMYKYNLVNFTNSILNFSNTKTKDIIWKRFDC